MRCGVFLRSRLIMVDRAVELDSTPAVDTPVEVEEGDISAGTEDITDETNLFSDEASLF
jgi:hypothetical protein